METSVFRSRSRIDRLAAQQLFEQVRRASRVASLLNDDAENHTPVVKGSPQKHTLSSALASHLIELPAWRWRTLATSKIGCDPGSTLHHSGTESFVAHIDAAIREHLFDITHDQNELLMEPTSELNHGGWEPVQFEENSRLWDLREAKKPWPSRRLVSVRLTTPSSGLSIA